MGLVKTRRLAAMQKQQSEDGIDVRRFPITKIIYHEGGYFGRPSAFAIDVRAGTFMCWTCDEMSDAFVWSPPWNVSGSDRARFMELVEACDFLAWQDLYEIQCCDGTHWDLEVKSGRKRLRMIRGSNAWPDQWKAVLRLLEFCHSPINFNYDVEDDDYGPAQCRPPRKCSEYSEFKV